MEAGTSRDLKPIECPICTEPLIDPRALLCGHSYCGPLKDCLKGVQKEDGGLKCAVCLEESDQDVSELKPLFGIREFLEQSTSGSHQQRKLGTLDSMCTNHEGCPILFWCTLCQKKSCQKCFNLDHQSHGLISYRNYLHQKVTQRFKIINSRIKRLYNDFLETDDNYKLLKEEIAMVKMKKQKCFDDMEKFQEFLEKWEQVNEFVENINYELSFPLVEDFLDQQFDEVSETTETFPKVDLANCLGFAFHSDLTYRFDKNPELQPVTLRNKNYRIEIKIFQMNALFDQSVCFSVDLVTNEATIGGVVYDGSVEFRDHHGQGLQMEEAFKGEIPQTAGVISIFENRPIINISKSLKKNGYLMFQFSFLFNVHMEEKVDCEIL